MITGNIVLDMLVGLLAASVGGAVTYGGYRLLTREPKHPNAKP